MTLSNKNCTSKMYSEINPKIIEGKIRLSRSDCSCHYMDIVGTIWSLFIKIRHNKNVN